MTEEAASSITTFNTFCLSREWNTNFTWFSPFLDFTPCFHKTVLVYVPCTILWLLAPIEFFLNAKHGRANLPWTWRNVSRLVVVGLLILFSLVEFANVTYVAFAGDEDAAIPKVFGADFVAAGVKLVTFVLIMLLIMAAKRSGRLSSAAQFVFWVTLSVCQGFTFGSVVSRDLPGLTPNVVAKVVLVAEFLLEFCATILACFADKPLEYMDIKEQIMNPSPETYSSWFARLLFFWFDMTVWRARKHVIGAEDLWDLNQEDSVKYLWPLWDRLWSRVTRQRNKDGNCCGRGDKPPLILGTLLQAFGCAITVSAIYQLGYVLLQFASPQLLNLLIAFVEGDGPTWHGYFYTVLFSVVALLTAMADSGYWYRVNMVGLRVRTSLSAAIYRKSLKLSNSARRAYTAGEIVNLISVDCQKLQDACAFINMMWSCPLQVGLAIYFLYNEIGVSVFVGLAALLIMFPLNGIIWGKMEKMQVNQMIKKDERVRMITEILAGIKVLKLYAWEPSFLARITDLRDQELYFLRIFQYLEGTQFFAWNCAPFVVALASFATFVLLDPINNVLDSQTAFVSLTLFNIMRGPLFLLPFGIVSLIQGAVSISRISKFLDEDELEPEAISHGEKAPFPVSLRSCTFSWGTGDEHAFLKDVNWYVPDSALVAVVGSVGSGKSSLLAAILGEMVKVTGHINVRGQVAYVPQQAWMQNETLKNNVLFGKRFNKDIYEKVIDVCALRPDLEILAGGDETEIGEKGINVSGGQKQRISLARAVYNDADLYLLDDPLSAVDSHVGKHIFEKVIGPRGILRRKTRILVTHAISFLPEMDQIVVLKDGRISEIGTYTELLRSRGAFAEFLLEQIQDGDSPGSSSSGLSDLEKEEIKHQLEETLGQREVRVALRRQQKQKKSKSKQRVRTSSIGGLSDFSDYMSDHESTFSLGGTGVGTVSSQRRRSVLEEKRTRALDRQASHISSDRKKVRDEEDVFKVGRDLVQDETAETKKVKFAIYVYYAKAVGGALAIAGIVFYAFFQMFTVGANLWLSVWSEDERASVDTSVRNLYLGIYGLMGLLQSTSILTAVIIITIGTLRASLKLHRQMLEHILGSTMAFFDTTPTGRIVNRFSKDMDEVDIMIPTHIKDILNSLFSVLGTVFVICYASPIIIVFIVPMIGIFLFIQWSYLSASRQLKRMVSVTRSPINSSLTETFSGAATIRAFNMQERFSLLNDKKIEANQMFYYPECASGSWLFCRLEGLANMLIIFASLFAVIYRDTINPGLVGLSLTYALTCQLDIFFVTRFTADLEKSIVSVERIKEYQRTPQEAPFSLPTTDPPSNAAWPQEGRVEFRDFAVRYREGMDLVLRGVSFTVAGGEKVGIVGRTGAGKSSLTLSLFRIIEAAEGAIYIDDVNTASLGLGVLRSALTIIPQDPVLFTGSLRFNLDPFHRNSDYELWNALEHAHLKTFVSSLPDKLGHNVAEGGENLSVGQRQLVCLARALLRKTKILVLDEATAAVDLETDDLIQATIRKEFSDCTVLTIAHRIKTIMDSDKILLLEAGMVKEFDSPQRLLVDPTSRFHSMARDAGLA